MKRIYLHRTTIYLESINREVGYVFLNHFGSILYFIIFKDSFRLKFPNVREYGGTQLLQYVIPYSYCAMVQVEIKQMAFLQKVSFCNFIRNNPRLFSACRRKKIIIAVASQINKSFYAFLNLQLQRIHVVVLTNIFIVP